jgi:quinol monooxygenase YgiN
MRKVKKMQNKGVIVTAYIKAKKGREEKVKEELTALISPTRSEQGCLSYDLHQNAEDMSQFMFFECWHSKSALDEHLQKPHIKAFIEKAGELLDGPLKVSLWEKIIK